MPLTVAMPCGFEENLMDFECSGGVAGSWGASSHTVTDFDHPDPLLMVSLSNKEQLNCANDGIGAIAGQFLFCFSTNVLSIFDFPFFLLLLSGLSRRGPL